MLRRRLNRSTGRWYIQRQDDKGHWLPRGVRTRTCPHVAAQPPVPPVPVPDRRTPEERSWALLRACVQPEEWHGDQEFIEVTGQDGLIYRIYFHSHVGNIQQGRYDSRGYFQCVKSWCGAPYNIAPEFLRRQQVVGRGSVHAETNQAAVTEFRRTHHGLMNNIGLPKWDLILGQYHGIKYDTRNFIGHCF